MQRCVIRRAFANTRLERKQQETTELIQLLSKCDLLRHLPPEDIESNPALRRHPPPCNAGEILFRVGDPGDALYIIASGKVEALAEHGSEGGELARQPLARLGEGHVFGEMGLLSGGAYGPQPFAPSRTPDLLQIGEAGLRPACCERDRQMAQAVRRLSHNRAIENLSAGGPNPAKWATVATSWSLDHLSRGGANKDVN